MITVQKARYLTVGDQPHDNNPTIDVMMEVTEKAIQNAIDRKETDCIALFWKCRFPRKKRKAYLKKLKELGYRAWGDWDDKVNIIHIRW